MATRYALATPHAPPIAFRLARSRKPCSEMRLAGSGVYVVHEGAADRMHSFKISDLCNKYERKI